MSPKAAVLAALITSMPLAPLAPLAQDAGSGTGVQVGPLEHDTSQPVEVTSDTLTVEDEKGLAIFEGNVVVIQGEMRMTAPRVRVEYTQRTEGSGADIDRMHATGGVTFVNGEEAAESKEAVYRPDDGNLVMTGDVILT